MKAYITEATFRRHARKQPRLTIMYCSLGLALQGVKYIMQPSNLYLFVFLCPYSLHIIIGARNSGSCSFGIVGLAPVFLIPSQPETWCC
jgi:hypothetical protein